MDKWTRLLIVIATVLLLLTFVGVGIHIATYVHHTLLLFALGALVAYALSPLVERLSRTRLSRPVSVALVFVSLLVLFGLGAWFLEGKLVAQVRDVQDNFPRYKQMALDRAAVLDQKLTAHNVHFSLVDTIQHPPSSVTSLGEQAGKDALPFVAAP